MAEGKPPTEYGEWTRGNAGQVGRTVTTWYESSVGAALAKLTGDESQRWTPVVDWEPHPDEQGQSC